MESQPTETKTPTNRIDVFRTIRKKLGQTQAGIADLLSVSKKAVQSYEQGWREIPQRVMKEMLLFLALNDGMSRLRSPCWQHVECPPSQRRQCPAFSIGRGRLCWMIAARHCSNRQGADPHQMPCLSCPVVQRLFS